VKNAAVAAALHTALLASAALYAQTPGTRSLQDVIPQTPPAASRYIFRVPVFPGTELFNNSPNLADLSPPFATYMEVYRTTDGRPLDKAAVIAFYHDALQSRGWKEGIFRGQKGEPYLAMRTDMLEDLPDGTRIQIAGDFYLWIAPADGMMTVFQKQWRISSPDQGTLNELNAMVARLNDAAPKAGYRVIRVSTEGGWKTDYENEYLLDRILYALIPTKAPSAGIDAPPGMLALTFLSYRDANIAAAEKNQREAIDHLSRTVAKDKLLVTISGEAAKDKVTSLLKAVTLP
jgi:hypothetical protein